MSESNSAAAAAAGEATPSADLLAAAAPTPGADSPGGDAGADPAEGAAGAAAAGEATETDPKPSPKPKAADRRFAHLSARAAALEAEKNAAERRADAAEALLRAGKPEGTDPPAPTRAQSPTDVETVAARLVADRAFHTRLSEIDTAGKAELGAEGWQAAKDTMTGLGAAGNTAFLQALAETENPAKIFAALSEDTDTLMGLLNKPPAAMAAKLGRMDAELGKPAGARPLSSAPKPAARVQGAGVLPVVDLYNYPPGMSMTEYAKLMDAQLPVHLGGKQKRA